ncbi:hypothetical protein RUM44_012925 [Polyplax serrata]|uniref:Major facilitator superfamily (MFS) profile domain-containing protein n=1 Tax=Polyplax serrata TaxID=468196 RepID=A0ABR1BCQ6_POLSC
MSLKRECVFPELNAFTNIPNSRGNVDGIWNAANAGGSKDENMNERLHGSQFSVYSAPVSDSYLQSLSLQKKSNALSSKLSLPLENKQNSDGVPSMDAKSDILPLDWRSTASREAACEDGHEGIKREETVEREDTPETLVRPCSLTLPSTTGKTLSLAAVANEAQLRQCPILVKDLSCETAEDDDNENHLTISSLTARPLIAKSHELRTKKVARKVREAERRARIRRFKPPDGGYGWAVVLGAFLVQFWVSGLVKSYGVLFVEVMETFSDTSAAVAAWIPAILSTLCLALAPVTSALCQKFTCRSVVFLGGLFCSAGLVSSYFATNSIHLLFTFGLLSGIGGGLSTTPGVLIVSRYFDKHRALANGICISGTAAGSFIFPILIQYLIVGYGFHGTILILGGCILHVCISAALYRPLSVHQRMVERSQGQPVHSEHLSVDIMVQCPDAEQGQAIKKLEFLFINEHIEPQETSTGNLPRVNSYPSVQEGTNADVTQHEGQVLSFSDTEEDKDKIGELLQVKPIFIRSCSILHSVEDLSTDSTCVYKDKKLEKAILQSLQTAIPEIAQVQKKKSISEKITQYLDISLLKNVKFMIMCCSVTLMSTGCPYLLYFLPAYVISSGLTKSQAGVLMVVSAALDFAGRLGFGWISDMKLFDRKKGYVSSIFGAGVAVLIIPTVANYYILAALIGIYGLCLGSWFLLVPVLLADEYGTNKISSTYGLVRLFQSFGAISVPPLAGYLRDITGSYEICFYFMGTCMVLGGVIFLLEPLASDCKLINEEDIPKINLPEESDAKV